VEVLLLASLVFSLGLAPVIVSAINVMVGAVRPEQAGEASAISETGSELGAALGIAVLGSIGASVYRSGMVGRIPEGVAHDVSQVAQDTLGGAFAATSHLPDEIQVQLLDAARTAFVAGFHVVAVLSTAIAAAMAVAIFIQTRLSRSAMPKVYQPERIDESGG
jgi:DHA2 family multidrug resistance protein-like MFS transporter